MSLVEKSETLVRGFPRVRYSAAIDHLPPEILTINGGSRIKIADIGGFRDNPILKELLSETSILSLNIPGEYHGRTGDITYDGSHMPLLDNSVPIMMAVDVLEQINPVKRSDLIKEMVRVAKNRVIVSGPYHSEINVAYEEELIDYMRKNNLPPKVSIVKHRDLGLPTLEELVAIGRKLRFPFHLYPATITALDFQGLLAQVEVLAKKSVSGSEINGRRIEIAKVVAEAIDKQLIHGPSPTWQQAYRAVLVIDKKPSGRIIETETELSLSVSERTAYQNALTQAGWGLLEDPLTFYPENSLRGRHIAFEGPDGSGKTTVMNRVSHELVNWGYQVAIPKKSGLRQDLRETEMRDKRLMDEPSREQHLATATVMAMIDANAFTLRGPCFIGLSERTLASVDVHHKIHGRQRPVTLVLKRAPRIPPDLTIVLEVDDQEENFHRMRQNLDLANEQIIPEQLALQRLHYKRLQKSRCTGPIVRIKNNGPIEETVQEVLRTIEDHCGIPVF